MVALRATHRCLGLCAILYLVLTVGGCQTPAQRNDAGGVPARGSAPGAAADRSANPSHQAIERDIIQHLNLVRTNPQAYSRLFILPRMNLFQGLNYFNALNPAQPPIRTREGAPAVAETAHYLAATAPMGGLEVSPALMRSAADHARDQSVTGEVGHWGSDGSVAANRVRRYGAWQRLVGEVIAYGPRTGMEVVARLLIDDGVPSRGHRRNILDPRFRSVGVAVAAHPGFGHVVVIDFADAVAEVVE